MFLLFLRRKKTKEKRRRKEKIGLLLLSLEWIERFLLIMKSRGKIMYIKSQFGTHLSSHSHKANGWMSTLDNCISMQMLADPRRQVWTDAAYVASAIWSENQILFQLVSVCPHVKTFFVIWVSILSVLASEECLGWDSVKPNWNQLPEVVSS